MVRLLPGSLGDHESASSDSFYDAPLLAPPAYTRPPEYRGMEVPEVLRSGDHEAISEWRRVEAERLRAWEVQIPTEEAMPLPPGQYYTYQIEGLAVYTEDGEHLGTVEEVLFTGGNAVHVTRGPRGEVLIPALKDVVLEVNVEAGRMVVRLPPGLLD